MLQNANSSVVRRLSRYTSHTHRSPTKAVDVENNQAKAPWRRHGHLLLGVTIVVTSLIAVAALQLRATGSRTATQNAMTLALDAVDSLQAREAAEASAALHQKMLAAVAVLDSSSATAEAVDLLAMLGPAAIGGDELTVIAYDVAVRDLVRGITRDANIATVRTQQWQMGIVAGAAIALIILIASVAARRNPPPSPRKSRAHHPSQTDPLTGLRRIDAIRARLAELLDSTKPGTGFVGLLAVGIQPEHEHFLPLTRSQLDAALLETSRRLRETVRATDVVARLARDELAVALPSSARVEDPGRVASKILGTLDRPIDVGDAMVRPNPRVGIAIAPLDAVTPDGLIQRARLARRAASDSPAAVYRSYSADLAPTELGSLEIQADLAAALKADDGQLWVAYQPKIDLNSERVVGFEALARWDHPVRGPISPGEFIAAAEETQLIVELGRWVLNRVCSQIATWDRHIKQRLPVSVNVSGRQFEYPGLASDIKQILQRHGVAPDLLELELTEGILLEDRLELISMMQELSELGVKIAVDDFGTGYSALSYLKRFPIDVLKIDRAFIRDLHGDESDEAISTAIISMAHSLALEVVAEGVETPEQLSVLRTLGCDAAQGFYFAHPAPPNEIETRAVVSS